MNLQDIKNRFSIIGNCNELNYALQTAVKVAQTDLTVLITGESGTGKEVFSQIIHQLSSRRHHPFIAINCGAIPEGTIDSELFGHEKGSFTGANESRKGYFETVDKGTIFLDEIAEMPMGTQARLLRLLQNGEFIRVGSSKIQKADVRVVAATNVNLLDSLGQNKFREDLYYRLNTVPIKVPPLRERGEDILLLFRKFSYDFQEKNKVPLKSLTQDANNLLLNYRWPGNVRQLKSVAEQVNLMVESQYITAEDLSLFLPEIHTNLAQIPNNQRNSDFNMYSNEVLFKILFDLKQDMHELKSAFIELLKRQSNSDSRAISSYHSDQDLNVQNHITTNSHEFATSIIAPISTLDPNLKQLEDEFQETNLNLSDIEKIYILKALERNKGKRKYAAEDLGISERTLYRKIIEYNIDSK
ncbi:MAG: sigma-54 dependent transcriptional regulator [Chitinophagales bacterium]|jgi:DNA-binding NtrC family response regulator|nr:sigma-54 dependent transcriptional regulator [Chitinophagales bacterium]